MTVKNDNKWTIPAVIAAGGLILSFAIVPLFAWTSNVNSKLTNHEDRISADEADRRDIKQDMKEIKTMIIELIKEVRRDK